MWTWGISNFESDTVLDWVDELTKQKTGDSINDFIKEFCSNFDPEETSMIDCSKFLAAAEIIAAQLSKMSDDFPEQITDWLFENKIILDFKSTSDIISTIEKMMKDSEIKEMYVDNADYLKQWNEIQNDLIARIS